MRSSLITLYPKRGKIEGAYNASRNLGMWNDMLIVCAQQNERLLLHSVSSNAVLISLSVSPSFWSEVVGKICGWINSGWISSSAMMFGVLYFTNELLE